MATSEKSYASGKSNSRLYTTLICSLLLVLFASSRVGAHAEKSRDLIVVIDVSTSMSDIFDRAMAEAKQFVSSAQLGDRITVITFGESSHLLERSRIRSSHDIARILSEIDKLGATEFATNLPVAMERGLKEMQQFYEDDPDTQRMLMWLSDDKNNPPKDIPNLLTFESLKKREIDQLPDHNWFVFESPIESESESELDWFVDWAMRIKMRLKVTLLTSDLGTLLAPEPQKEFSVRFEPDTPAIWGSWFSVVAEVTDRNGGPYSATVPVTPPVIVCRDSKWVETFHVALPDRPGDYVCRVSFVLPSDKMLEITPPQAMLKAKVQPEIRTVDQHVASFDGDISTTSDKPLWEQSPTQTAFAAEVRSELQEEARQSVSRVSLVFGPIVADGQYRESISLFPTRNIPLESIQMETSFELPEGLELQPSYRISDGTLVADLCLAAGGSPMLSDGWEIRGPISFLSTEAGVVINPASIPARFYSKNVLSRWGKRELPDTATYGRAPETMQAMRLYANKVVKALLMILAVWLVYYAVRKYGIAATRLTGTLEIVESPSGRKMNPFNLRRMGRFKRTNSLTIGNSRMADIVLPHSSVADLHAKITTATTDAATVMFVQPLEHNQIVINDIACDRRKELANEDTLSIGEFVLRYSCPDTYRETLLQFADGSRIRGLLISWDIEASSFEFLPKGTPSVDTRMVVDFSELRTVSFIRKTKRFPGWRLFRREKSPVGRPVEVIFEDGEMLEGYMVGDTDEWSKRFYLIPKELGEIGLVLVERSAVQNIASGYAFGPMSS